MTWLPLLALALSLAYGLVQEARQRARSPARAQQRALARTPRRTIGDYVDGKRSRFVGSVRLYHGEAVPAPLTGRLCVAWVVRGYRHAQGSRHEQRVLVHEEAGCVPFFLEDRTGRCLVGTGETRLDLDVDNYPPAPSGQIQRYLQANPGLKSARGAARGR
jgi:hypothetical protein